METGYNNYGARYYSSDLGIFLSVDPLADVQPWQSPYAYCSNNPINKIDPTGMSDHWVEGADGIYWDNNATSQATTKPGETYLGPEGYGADNDGMLTHYRSDQTQSPVVMQTSTVTITAESNVISVSPGLINMENRAPYSGFWGTLDYIWNGGIENGQRYNYNGEWIGKAPLMGTPPVPSFSGANIVKLTKGGASVLGGLKNLKDMNIADAIKARGGSGQNVNKIADWLRGKSVGDVANQAAQGNAEAKTAIKVLKEAKRLSEKY